MGAGYLCFQTGTDGETWAALLVVGATGLPLEFLYSGPLRATPVQVILYQDRLESEVRRSLVRSLLRGLRVRLALVGVEPADLDAELMAEVPCPILLLPPPASGGPAWAGDPSPAALSARERLDLAVGAEEPLGRARAALAYVVEFERAREGAGT